MTFFRDFVWESRLIELVTLTTVFVSGNLGTIFLLVRQVVETVLVLHTKSFVLFTVKYNGGR